MSAPIGPGDYVECVDVSPSPWLHIACPLKLGAIYVVERLVESRHPKDRANPIGLKLVGVPFPDPRVIAWPAYRFRPVYRPKQELISRLLSDVPAREPA